MSQATRQTFELGRRYIISVEDEDGKTKHILEVFDTTVSLAKQIERIFDAVEINPFYKDLRVIKVERH